MRHFILLSATLLAALSVACSDIDFSAQPPKVYFASEGNYEISLSDTLTLSPRILYDDASSYNWTVDGVTVSNQKDYVFVPSARKNYSLRFEVSTAYGSDSHDVNICVSLRASADSFDNFALPTSSAVALMPDSIMGAFRYSGLSFANLVSADSSAWAGFAFSNVTTIQNSVSKASAGVAYVPDATQNNYLAVNASANTAIVYFGGDQFSPVSVDLANDNLVYVVSKYGALTADSAVVSPVAHDDYFRVVVYGLDSSGSSVGTPVSHSLIDCAYDNPAKYVRQSSWATVDLSSIGRVSGLLFTVETSCSSYPQLFCLDNLRLQD